MRLTLPVSDATFSGPFLASRVSICIISSARFLPFFYRGPQYFYCGPLCISVTHRPQVLQPGPAVRTRSGVEGLFELVAGYHYTFSDHVDIDYE